MNEITQLIAVDAINYDTNNPRIKKALEKFGGKLTAERIHFALRSATNGNHASSYESLKDSIRASGGIIAPIIVVPHENRYMCIDGNTRLAIYKQFQKEGIDGDWSKIKASILEGAEQRDIETIRVAAHLVGAREWPAYEKARYLHYLRTEKFLEYSEMIALCGGNKTEIERQIDAYHDMNEYYRDVVDDTAFQIDRFSGFVELQKPKLKEAIFSADLGLENFGEWIRDGKIYKLANVRDLPKVLGDDDARQLFLEGGPRSIEEAIRLVDRKLEQETGVLDGKVTLQSASTYQLVKALLKNIDELPYSRIQELRNTRQEGEMEEIYSMESLSVRLQGLLRDVSE